MMLVDPTRRQLPVSLQLADEPPKESVRVHLDLYTSEHERHVERLVMRHRPSRTVSAEVINGKAGYDRPDVRCGGARSRVPGPAWADAAQRVRRPAWPGRPVAG